MVRDREVERMRSEQYNAPAIRNLIRDAFTVRELWRFCQDRPAFRPILTHCSPNPSLEDIVDALTEYCRTHVLFSELLLEIRQFNPQQYQRHRTRLYGSDASTEDAIESESVPQGIRHASAPVTVLIDSSVDSFTPIEQESFIFTLSRIVDISPEQICVLRVARAF
jgi:hypothetical protein